MNSHTTDYLGANYLIPPKVFSKPFRLALVKKETDELAWIEVSSLKGLRNVLKRVSNQELVEVDRFSSIEMQLWGLLAEHSGFLRYKGDNSSFAEGIQPMGEESTALAEDLNSIVGGDAEVIELLNNVRNTINKNPNKRDSQSYSRATDEESNAEDCAEKFLSYDDICHIAIKAYEETETQHHVTDRTENQENTTEEDTSDQD